VLVSSWLFPVGLVSFSANEMKVLVDFFALFKIELK